MRGSQLSNKFHKEVKSEKPKLRSEQAKPYPTLGFCPATLYKILMAGSAFGTSFAT